MIPEAQNFACEILIHQHRLGLALKKYKDLDQAGQRKANVNRIGQSTTQHTIKLTLLSFR